ncbi:MAG: AI-2E family transporter, partial [Patescibacteria group bacterium]|nr:AI-2E family transporter [Patescibacteria group bacterium]
MPESSQSRGAIVSTGTIIKFFLIGLLILALYYLSDVVLVVVAAIVFASAIEPLIRRLVHYHIHRVVAAILIYVVVAAFLAGLLLFFVPVVANDAISFLSSVPKTISVESLWSPIRDIGTTISSSSLGPSTISVGDFITGLKSLLVGTSAGAFQTASVIFGGFLGFVLIVVLSFYLAVQEEGVADFLRIVTPVKHHEYIIGLWKRSQRKIGYWLQGQILLGLVVGVLVYLVLMVVGIPYALILAVLAAVFEIIPVFGPVISSVPAILIAFADKGVGTGLLLIGLYIIIYQFESQLFYPLVVKKIVGISPIVVILALVIGAQLAGILGALIAVPLSAVLMEYLHD